MTLDDAMRATRDHTDASAVAVHRVRARLDQALRPASELGALPTPSADAIRRVRARLAPRPARARWWGLGAAALLAGSAALAAGILARPPAPLDQPLHDGVTIDGPDLQLTARGTGHLTGSPPIIRWDSGVLELTARRPVRVVTAEGTVDLDAGVLVLTRDAMGTTVNEGAPRITCAHAGPGVCLPTTPAGLLARGRALERAGSPPDLVLDTLDAAVARLQAGDPLLAEVHAARVGPLLERGERDAALRAAETGLTVAGPREAALHRVAARLRLAIGDCAGAVPHLEALEDRTEAEQAHLTNCQP